MSDTGLIRYDAMVGAIAECERVDEAKDIRDKAQALEVYFKQARNLEAERKAANVRLRAERRAGELMQALQREQGRRTDREETSGAPVRKSEYAAALETAGIGERQARRFQALANVPAKDFEAALAEPEKPSTTAVLKRATLKADPPRPQVSDDALWLWGRLRDFERMGLLAGAGAGVLDTMTDAMRADVLRLAPHVADFLANLGDKP